MSASIRGLWQRDSKLPFQKLEEGTIVVDPARGARGVTLMGALRDVGRLLLS